MTRTIKHNKTSKRFNRNSRKLKNNKSGGGGNGIIVEERFSTGKPTYKNMISKGIVHITEAVGINVARDMKQEEFGTVINNLQINMENDTVQYNNLMNSYDTFKQELIEEFRRKEESIRQNDIKISRQKNIQEQTGQDIDLTEDKVEDLTRKEGISDVNATKIESEISSLKRTYLAFQVLMVISMIIVGILVKKMVF